MLNPLRCCWMLAILTSSLLAQNQVLSISSVGREGFLEVPHTPSLTPPNITIEAWFRYTDSGLPVGFNWPTLIRKGFPNTSADYMIRIDASNSGQRTLRVWLNTVGGIVNVSDDFNIGEYLNWTHVAVTFDGSIALLYVNGILVAATGGLGAMVGQGEPMRIGNGRDIVGGPNDYWNGVIREVRVWSAARTLQEIESTMFARNISAPNLVASYSLNGNGLDSSSGGNHATTVGAPLWPMVPTHLQPFEINDPESSLDIDGRLGSPLYPARTLACTYSSVRFNSSGLAGALWEMVFNSAPITPSPSLGSYQTPGGQVVNVNLAAGAVFLNGGAAPGFLPYPGAFSLPVSAPSVATTLSMQQVVTSPTNAEGASLSQSVELNVVPPNLPSSVVPGPVGDDQGINLNTGCLTFYGRSYTTIAVETNGRMLFGTSFGFSPPALSNFFSGLPSFGCYADFVAQAGNIAISQPTTGLLRVDYVSINHFLIPGSSTFSLEFDTLSGALAISGLSTVIQGPRIQIVGLSRGGTIYSPSFATTAFSWMGAGTSGITNSASQWLYSAGNLGQVVPGINRIDFYPNAFQNYDWVSQ